MSKAGITAEEFDAKFDAGEDISEYLDFSQARRPGLEKRQLDVNVPGWIVERLDRQAQKQGVSREALVGEWLAERLDKAA